MTLRTSISTRRGLTLVAAAAVSTVCLTGCGELANPTTTELHYDAADGYSATLGSVKIENALLVTSASGGSARAEGLVYNQGDSAAQLTLSVNGESKAITVPAQESVRLDGKPNGNDSAKVPAVTFSNIGNAKPGDTTSLTIKSNSNGSTSSPVPVVLDQSPYGSAAASHPSYPGKGANG